MGLAEYKRKRDFKKTAEPAGKPLPKKVKGASRFVIQKHAARRLHYDFRLEMEEVLKSWALPKGLPWNRGEKHLAVEVEDHPIEYEDFEGVIPEGQYGGGTVMVWDRGTYYVFGEQPLKSLREGKLHLVLDGKKAKGEWTLVRIHGRDGEKNQWLILKTGDDAKPRSKKLEDQSVKTGRTMKQIADARDAEWQSNRLEDESPTSQFKARIREAIKKKVKDEAVGQAHRLPAVQLGSRSGRPTIASLFDLLQLDGKSLVSLPLEARKNVLERLCAGARESIRYSGAIGSDANPLLEEVNRRGLEGIIGKQRNSIYEPGRRSGAWIKLKCVNEQEFVIGGYTPPQGARKHFGAILVGYYDKSKPVFAGKVGTGFTAKSLSILHKKLQKEARNDCPFVDLPSKQNGEWVLGITPSMMKKMRWTNPEFVAEIKFAEWTRDGKLRAPVFLGLREDKKPTEIVREG